MKDMTSIFIATFNGLGFTKQCLKSIFDNVSVVKTDYEVIVCDNGSTDGTVEYLNSLEKQGMIKVIYNKENMGFPKAQNHMAEVAQGKYYLLLNNDTLVTKGFLDNLIRCIKTDPKICAVGPYSNAVSGRQKSPISCSYKGVEELEKFSEKFSQEEKYTDFLVFFCCLIKSEVWKEIGGLDEEFTPGNFEDNLFCWKALDKGYKLKICGNSFVHHFCGGSFGYNNDHKKQKAYSNLLARNQKIFMSKIDKYKKISLCMIVGDYENHEDFKRALSSIAQWVDEINIVFNFKHTPINYLNYIKLLKILNSFYHIDKYNVLPDINHKYIKFNNYAYARNISLSMSTGDYCIWMDCDDVFEQPMGIRDLILYNPDIDVFKVSIKCPTEINTEENIIKNVIFKNRPEYKFKGIIHEDISESQSGAKYVLTNLSIRHFGYIQASKWIAKNRRNYIYLKKEMEDNPDIMTYFHLINCLMVLGRFDRPKDRKKKAIEAIRLVDEAFKKFNPEHKDPITPKLWVLRGACCLGNGPVLSAKQSFHKAWDEWKNPEAAVQLGAIYLQEENFDKVIEILTEVYKLKEFKLAGIPIDVVQVECAMLEQLGDAYNLKFRKENKLEFLRQAEVHYREFLSVRTSLKVMESLSTILRETGRIDEANFLDVQCVNKFPGSVSSWYNLAQTEMLAKRYVTARLFLMEAKKYSPEAKDINHNLNMINKIIGIKK